MAIVTGKRNLLSHLAAHAGILVFLALVLFPFFMIISISLRPGNFAVGSLIPPEISFEHWKLALGISYEDARGNLINPPFPVLTWLWNSVKIATITAFLILALSTTSAYAFARMKFRFKGAVLNSILLLQMFPAALTLIAIFSIFDTLGDYIPWLGVDTHGGLILSYLGGIALHVWTIKGYFESIPVDIEEAASVDGANTFQTFIYVLLPMAVPILMVVFVLAFIGTLIEYPVASILLHQENNLTLAVGSKFFLYEQNYLWGDFAAAAVLSGLPITAVFLLAQKWIVSGLTVGGSKG
jgi:maltose/maltodextrin transport system permease protein